MKLFNTTNQRPSVVLRSARRVDRRPTPFLFFFSYPPSRSVSFPYLRPLPDRARREGNGWALPVGSLSVVVSATLRRQNGKTGKLPLAASRRRLPAATQPARNWPIRARRRRSKQKDRRVRKQGVRHGDVATRTAVGGDVPISKFTQQRWSTAPLFN